MKGPRRPPKLSAARAAGELTAVVAGVSAVVVFVPLTSRWFVAATASAGLLAGGYAWYGAARVRGAAKRWGLVWGGKDAENLARGLYHSGLLFALALVPAFAVRCLVRTPTVPHPAAYLFWCFVQDFLFFSLGLRAIERLTSGRVAWHRHLAVWATAGLFGLSHFPLGGFMLGTAALAVFWGYIFLQCRLLWPVTLSHFTLGLMVML